MTERQNATPLRILVVDDNPDDRDLAMRELKALLPGASVTPVGNNESLEQALAAGDFDVVITDYLLRWSDGLQVARLAKARYPDRPVIMFTDSGSEEVAVEAMKSGLDDYILKKPLYFARLPLAVHAAVDRAEAKRAAAEALRARERFLILAAHELRTPLTSIIASVDIASRRIEGAVTSGSVALEAVPPLLARARRELSRLNRLVEDLMDTARLQRDEFTLDMRVVDLRAIVDEAVEAQRNFDPTRDIRVIAAAQPAEARADADRIEQVVANYLNNALKFSASDTPVLVETAVTDHYARVSVRDYGPGLPEEEVERIWQPFYRVEGLRHRSGSSIGLGLGLSVAQTIIAQHGGRVGVTNAPDGGSIFWFELPLAGATE